MDSIINKTEKWSERKMEKTSTATFERHSMNKLSFKVIFRDQGVCSTILVVSSTECNRVPILMEAARSYCRQIRMHGHRTCWSEQELPTACLWGGEEITSLHERRFCDPYSSGAVLMSGSRPSGGRMPSRVSGIH